MHTLLTGANGFLGLNIKNAINKQGITTLGLRDCDYNINLAKEIPFFDQGFERVIHAAGKAHVIPRTPKEEEDFYQTNVQGTRNLLSALSQTKNLPHIFIFISTVSVYGVENAVNFDESAPLLGTSPYAQSKIQAENIVQEWGLENNVNIIILRLSLLVGENPPGTLGNMYKAIRCGYYFRIGTGSARRSMVLATDVANLIVNIDHKSGIFNLTDGYHPSFKELEEAIASQMGKKIKRIPPWLALIAARAGDLFPFVPLNSRLLEKLKQSDTYNDDKARNELGWKPRKVLDSFSKN